LVWWSNPSGVADYCMGLDNDTVLDAALTIKKHSYATIMSSS
jgi:hypothetical protein